MWHALVGAPQRLLRDVRADHVDACVVQRLREPALPAAKVEHTLAWMQTSEQEGETSRGQWRLEPFGRPLPESLVVCLHAALHVSARSEKPLRRYCNRCFATIMVPVCNSRP